MKRRAVRTVFVGVLATSSVIWAAAPMPADAARRSPVTATADPPQLPDSDSFVVKVDVANGRTISQLTSFLPLRVKSTVLASQGIYLVETPFAWGTTAGWATFIANTGAVLWAEPDIAVALDDTRLHAWPNGQPAASSAAQYSAQPLVSSMQLPQVRQFTRGSGITVAVLDTGIAANHPAVRGNIVSGYDYVGDDSDPSDAQDRVDSNRDGRVDGARGHGTFTSGLVRLIAPDVKIMPQRVLDSDGTGNIFVVAQAINDAVSKGAQVINMSFGTSAAVHSKLLDDAIGDARSRGVIVVAAAGNLGTDRPTYPASLPGVVSVAALDSGGRSLGAYSSRGSWVKSAAPGTNVIGPIPGGRYASWSGSSMAAPVVAGQMALLRSKRPTQSSTDVVASALGTANRDPGNNGGLGIGGGAVDILASLR